MHCCSVSRNGMKVEQIDSMILISFAHSFATSGYNIKWLEQSSFIFSSCCSIKRYKKNGGRWTIPVKKCPKFI